MLGFALLSSLFSSSFGIYRYNSLLSLVLGQKLRLDAWDLGLWSALSLSLEEKGTFPTFFLPRRLANRFNLLSLSPVARGPIKNLQGEPPASLRTGHVVALYAATSRKAQDLARAPHSAAVLAVSIKKNRTRGFDLIPLRSNHVLTTQVCSLSPV